MRPVSRLRVCAGVLASMAVVGCAPITPPPESEPASALMESSSISVKDLGDSGYPSLYEAIAELRGAWLRKHGPVSLLNERDIVVYLDGNRLGGLEALRTIPVFTVVSVRRMSPPEAHSFYGLDHPQGAIVVRSRRE